MDNNYKDYTLGLVLFDNIPVILFLISGLVIHGHFDSKLFLVSIVAMFIGGTSKVIWKLLVVIKKTDVALLTKAFRILMFGGFAAMILSVILRINQGVLTSLIHGLTSMSSMLMFIIGIARMCVMGYLGKHMDTSARSNWIEEAVNTVSQLAILIGLLLL